ncbi:MAG: right-handed parallel beta-helix repeat-containing protein [Gloeobacteraceae cyanobacterium ES-bin-144]|nr:right-handed parallel beta-helix repeat-containing protein [Verrucomicrobiales bacterium]
MKKIQFSPPNPQKGSSVIFLIGLLFISSVSLGADKRVIEIPSGGEQILTDPEVTDAINPKPKAVKWVEPKRLGLPSREDLVTHNIRGKTYHINRSSKAVEHHLRLRALAASGGTGNSETVPPGFDPLKPFASYEKLDESPAFLGGGGGGLRSKERLIVEDCVFIMDFTEGDFEKFDPKRSAIFVEGYNEVLVRNCVFFSRSSTRDPLRKTTASIYASDCQKVEVDNCYFEGRTIGWRGHINVWSCGPTSITHCEINGKGAAAGGIWVATGLGEGKIDYAHSDGDPSLVIYPPGPVLVENCWVHDQKAKENSDGIFIQSARPYLIRNCKVENWGPDDSLIDVGFRDTSKTWDGRFLSNHGGLGMIENCELAGGWIKDSVGLAGGLVFRNNLIRDAFFFFYAFDGGSFYCVGNRFEPTDEVLFSGRNNGTDGWTPREGMLGQGGKAYFFNNHFKRDSAPAAIYVAGADTSPVKGNIVSNYNHYDMPPPPVMGIEGSKEKGTRYTLDQWRGELGQDVNSIFGAGSREAFKNANPQLLSLPGGIPMSFGENRTGLVSPVGVTDKDTLDKMRDHSAKFAADHAAKNFDVAIGNIKIKSATMDAENVRRKWGDKGEQLNLKPSAAGQELSFTIHVSNSNRYYVGSRSQRQPGAGIYQLLINSETIGEPFEFPSRGGTTLHGPVKLSEGEHVVTYKFVSPGIGNGTAGTLDGIQFIDAEVMDAEIAARNSSKAQAATAASAKARLDAETLKFPITSLLVIGNTNGRISKATSKSGDYLLWQTAGKLAMISFKIEVPESGTYTIRATTVNQEDKGALQLQIDGKDVNPPAKLGGNIDFGEAELSKGDHILGLKQVQPDATVKIRLNHFKLLPFPAAP